jgi:hypothetical protein
VACRHAQLGYPWRVAIQVVVPPGELIDRITILEIKAARLPEPARSAVQQDLGLALAVRDRARLISPRIAELSAQLLAVNLALWEIEEQLRQCERAQSFGREFVTLARCVYQHNDRRAALKRAIDAAAGSDTTEHKSHPLPEL